MSPLPTYDAERLGELLGLLPDVDSVELKLTVPDADHRRVLDGLGIDALDAELRQVAFIDTPDLRLSGVGLVVRARRTQRKAGDVAVKLRPMLPADVPEDLRGIDGFKVEIDASPQGFTCSCSLTVAAHDHKVRALYGEQGRLAKLLSATQRKVLDDHLPAGVALADLRVLGPLTLLKAKFEPEGLARKMVAELWFLPDGSRILELSTKAPPRIAFQAAAETKVFLAGRGIDLAAPQDTKTRTAMRALAATLPETPRTDPGDAPG
ncbi:adenylate cyclase [Nocardioides sambongensis]|uniref:adenylate cyclase n=1 Tax=Nocardioides sambongensis TaxID=2589074 RepID=UPI0011283DD3|nr:adenylate cyclase [Nocardioides sambongensis]